MLHNCPCDQCNQDIVVQKPRCHILFGKRLPFEERIIANLLMKTYDKITSGQIDESKLIPVKHIVMSVLCRTESHKIKSKDRVKSSEETVQFADDFIN